MKREHNEIEVGDSRLPVTILGGFLGAGKTTLLRQILESNKHKLKCAVIVNDMAELNIDKSLIQGDGIIQSEEVISMQNGCVCCSLSGDLVDQIIRLIKTKKKDEFDYLFIEASGVSEPRAIAQLFAECQDDHDHAAAHSKDTVLSDVARLDTCVTVVDSASFLPVLFDSNTAPEKEKERLPQIMVEQIEYSDIILLNKTDLVSSSQLERIQQDIQLLNDRAQILPCLNCTIDAQLVMNTRLFRLDNFGLEATISRKLRKASTQAKSCCKASKERGEPPCCRSARTIQSDKSQVLLPSTRQAKTRHEEVYGITSFVYQARRPFHPERFRQDYLSKYFVVVEDEEEEEDDEEDDDDDEKERGDDVPVNEAGQGRQKEEEKQHNELDRERLLQARQQDATSKQAIRVQELGMLLRSKGYLWIANTHDLQGFLSQASNMVTLELPGVWTALQAKAWAGTDEEKRELRQHWVQPWGDRRQEMVFIGQDLKHTVIQSVLDSCLLTDEELAMGSDGWKATMGDAFLGGPDHSHNDPSEEDIEGGGKGTLSKE